MNDTKHTPGPWAVADGQGQPALIWKTSPARPIATVSRSGRGSNFPNASRYLTKEDEANARLIASAPTLVEALAQFLGAAETDGLDLKSNVYRSIMIEARQALRDAGIES